MSLPARHAVARPREIAAGVFWVPARGANVYCIGSGSSWALVDTSWANRAGLISASAESLFGVGSRPAAILITHLHPDHSGSAAELARIWDVPVYVHPDEMPLMSGKLGYSNPIGQLATPLTRFLPPGEFGAGLKVVRPIDPHAPLPGLPDWRCVLAPGHTPGHIALFRNADRVLVTGDALLTIDVHSVPDLLLGKQMLGCPPAISTWDRARAQESVARLARLAPHVLAPGHGRPMAGETVPGALNALVARLGLHPAVIPRHG